MIIVTYLAIDSTEETEKEFATQAEVNTFLASMDDLMQWHDVYVPDCYCPTHGMWEAEGGPCAECERLAEEHVARMDAAMNTYQYSLWVMPTTGKLFKVPVQNFNEAKNIYHSLRHECVTSVRIARFDPTEGCESVLHKFK